MRLRIAAAVLLILVGGGAVAFVLLQGSSGSSTNAANFLTGRTATGDVTIQVAATGNIQATTTYNLAFGQAPQLAAAGSSTASSSSSSGSGGTGSGGVAATVLTVNAAVGQLVKAGSVLATEETAAANLALANAQATLASAQAKLAADQVGATSVTIQGAQLALSQAQQQLTNAKQNQADNLAQNNLSLQQAQAAVDAAAAKVASEADPTKVAADQAALTSAQQQLANTKVKVTASNHQAAASVASAQLGLSSAQNAYATKTEPTTPAQIQSDQAAVASAQQAVDAAQKTLTYTTLTAPIDGTITVVNVQVGFAAPSGTAIQLVGNGLQVTAQVSESDVSKLKVGQAASITPTALGVTLDGTVSAMGATASSAANSVVSYPVTVTLTNPPAELRIGMSADVTIINQQVTGVLTAPTAAIEGSNGSYAVTVLNADGTTQTVAVGIGLVGDSLTEITSGLQAGERVVTGVNTSRTGTTTTAGGLGGLGGLGGGANFGGGARAGANGGRTTTTAPGN